MITPEVITTHNLSTEEFERIQSLLGREPNLVELGIFSAYRASKPAPGHPVISPR